MFGISVRRVESLITERNRELKRLANHLGVTVAELKAADGFKLPTFSAGVAEFRPGETPSTLIERADSALYAAKRKGRNCTEISGEEQAMDSHSPTGVAG